MAIISQNNPQTLLDYRRYDVKKPNRFLPCKIDAELEEKIGLFMREMEYVRKNVPYFQRSIIMNFIVLVC